MTWTPFQNIHIPLQYRSFKTIKTLKEVEGYDTETDNGYARIIAHSGGYRVINNFRDVLEFLTQHSHRNTLNYFWNLGFDVECMLKWQPDVLHQLTTSNSAQWQKYKFKYIPKKFLCITDDKHHSYSFYDIAQFYHSSLENAARRYLNVGVHSFKTSRATLFKDHSLQAIGDYCVADAVLTRDLSKYFVQCVRGCGINPRHYYSCGHLSQEYCLRYADIPHARTTPLPILREYWNAYRGGWFDTYKKGMFEVTSYDINSAYPTALLHLPDFRDGVWKRGYYQHSQIGVCRCSVSGLPDTGTALGILIKNKRIYPSYDTPTTMNMTFREYRTLRTFLHLKLLDAWSFIPHADCRYPYKKLIQTLYKKKSESSRDSMEYLLFKIVMNSMYGKSAQVTKQGNRHVAGKLWNPVYAAEITAFTRCQMFEAIQHHLDSVVSILTDGVMFSKPVRLNTSNELGGWSQKHDKTPCVVVQTGIYQFANEQPATRGFSRHNNLFELLKTQHTHVTTLTLRPRHFRECIKQKHAELIGVFNNEQRVIDVNNDNKRLWLSTISHASDLLEKTFDSIAIPISLLHYPS